MNEKQFALEAARKHNVTAKEILQPTRGAPRVVRARWEAWAAAHRHGWSMAEIGRRFGRDHTSVAHALRALKREADQ